MTLYDGCVCERERGTYAKQEPFSWMVSMCALEKWCAYHTCMGIFIIFAYYLSSSYPYESLIIFLSYILLYDDIHVLFIAVHHGTVLAVSLLLLLFIYFIYFFSTLLRIRIQFYLLHFTCNMSTSYDQGEGEMNNKHFMSNFMVFFIEPLLHL